MKDCTKTSGWKLAREKSTSTVKNKKQKNIDVYNENPKLCKNCLTSIDYNKRYNEFCSKSCAAILNNSKFPKRIKSREIVRTVKDTVNRTKYYINCKGCSVEFFTYDSRRLYCQSSCKSKTVFLQNVNKFRNDQTISHAVARRVLISEYGAVCSLCGWDKVNPTSGKVPIELDHIDGDSSNTIISNTRLLCPNCHSLQPTYKALNKGKGRHSRLVRYHTGKSH